MISETDELIARLCSNIKQYRRGILSLDDIEEDEKEAATHIKTYADERNALKEAAERVVSNAGDAIANMFDQMIKGNWKDDLDHDVRLNTSMLKLQDVIIELANFRTSYLGYTAVIDIRGNLIKKSTNNGSHQCTI